MLFAYVASANIILIEYLQISYLSETNTSLIGNTELTEAITLNQENYNLTVDDCLTVKQRLPRWPNQDVDFKIYYYCLR